MPSSSRHLHHFSAVAVICTLLVANWQVGNWYSAAEHRVTADDQDPLSRTHAAGAGFDPKDNSRISISIISSSSNKQQAESVGDGAVAKKGAHMHLTIGIAAKKQGTNSANLAKTDSNKNSSSVSTDYAEEVLTPFRAAAARATSDPSYLQKLRGAASKPINVAVMTGLYWSLPTEKPVCEVAGIKLDCHVQNGGTEEFLNKADALYYHIPSFAGQVRAKAFPSQLRVAVSYESSAHYPKLIDPAFMCQFDAEMTFRACGQVKGWYSEVFGTLDFDQMFNKTKPVPFEEKLHAIAYVNRNCADRAGRASIMRALINLKEKAKVPVHALGNCDRNKPWPPGNPNKTDVLRSYKFCVAMENSIERDYLTEKMWDALAAGCIPIYMGSPTARDTVPDPESFIMYDPSGKTGHASTPEQLDALMHEIGSDKVRYEAMLSWKKRKPEEQPNEVFRHLWSMRHTTSECSLCQFLARHRVEPQPTYTTCLFNKEWMARAGHPFIPMQQACPKH